MMKCAVSQANIEQCDFAKFLNPSGKFFTGEMDVIVIARMNSLNIERSAWHVAGVSTRGYYHF